jgi:CRP-like cAMP-binding protein
MTQQDRFTALRGTKLAEELTDDQCRTLAALVTLHDLKQGTVLAKEGEVDNHIYVILSGNLGVVKNFNTGDQLTINTLGPGDFVGEMGFMDGTEAYASKVALGHTRVLALEREKLESLLDKEPLIVYRVMRAIIRVVHQIQRRLSMHQVELSNYIYKQHGRY